MNLLVSRQLHWPDTSVIRIEMAFLGESQLKVVPRNLTLSSFLDGRVFYIYYLEGYAMKVACIGAGSMAEAMISGIVDKEFTPAKDIVVMNRSDEAKLTRLQEEYGVSITRDPGRLLEGASVILFAVKPKDAKEALDHMRPFFRKDALFISVLAGISISFLESELPAGCAIARAMPNTSASIGLSATAVAFNSAVTKAQKELCLGLFSSIGIAAEVEERQLDAVTGLSGSGPAYIYYIVEAMERSAAEAGLDKETARWLIIQTLAGAAEMLARSTKNAGELRAAVTSPGGTTEAGISVLDENHVKDIVGDCIKAAAARSRQMQAEFASRLSDQL